MPVLERTATFDNDGTLWVEQPMYTQLAFALDRVKALVPLHPEWRGKQPFKAVLDGDMKALGELGERGMLELVMATHADMTTEERRAIPSMAPGREDVIPVGAAVLVNVMQRWGFTEAQVSETDILDGIAWRMVEPQTAG